MPKNVYRSFLTCLFFTNVFSLDVVPDFLKSDVFNIHKHVAIQTREIERKPVLPEDITFFMFSKENINEYINLTADNLNVLAEKKRKIVFFIHGWTSSRNVDWYERLKDAFLTTYGDQYAVVQVDWQKPAKQFYYVSSINTYDVAKIVTDIIIKLNHNYGIPLDDFLLIGHSLGGQTAGFVGKLVKEKTGKKLPRIIAMDPAGPLFDTRPEDKRLNKNDAEVVEVLHSDGGTFGFLNSCGTIDFFPNGGSSQPGCKRIDLLDIRSVVEPVSCDHIRATEYLIEAILNPKELTARKCETWKKFILNQCEEETVALGDLTTTKTGNFYLETNRERPYSKSGTSRGSSGLGKIVSIIKSRI